MWGGTPVSSVCGSDKIPLVAPMLEDVCKCVPDRHNRLQILRDGPLGGYIDGLQTKSRTVSVGIVSKSSESNLLNGELKYKT